MCLTVSIQLIQIRLRIMILFDWFHLVHFQPLIYQMSLQLVRLRVALPCCSVRQMSVCTTSRTVKNIQEWKVIGKSTSKPQNPHRRSVAYIPFSANNRAEHKYLDSERDFLQQNVAEQWQISISLLIERFPVVTPPRTRIEEEYAELVNQMEAESSHLSKHEIWERDHRFGSVGIERLHWPGKLFSNGGRPIETSVA